MKIRTLFAMLTLLCLLPTYAGEMQAHLSKTRVLVEEGKFEEALERHVWYHSNALKHDPDVYGVRLSFALNNWVKLGSKYPPAHKALVKIRDEKTKGLIAGKKNRDFFHDVVSINRVLGKPRKTVELFVLIDEGQPEAATEYWGIAKDAVIEAKKYELAGKYMKNSLGAYEEVKDRYDENVKLYDHPQIGGAEFKKYTESSFVDECVQLIEVCLAVKKKIEANAIQQKALGVLDDKRLRDAIKVK